MLALVAGDVPSALVPTKALRRLREVAREWPATTEMGFECRLGRAAGQADLGLCTRSRRADRAGLLRALRAQGGGEPDTPLLEALAAIDGADAFVASAVRNVCLEIDLAPAAAGVALFAGLWHPGTEHLEGAPGGDPVPARAVAEPLAELLLERGLPRTVLDRLETLERSLPPGCYVGSMGLMPRRSPRVIRVNVGWHEPLEAACGWLDGEGWKGDRHARDRAIALAGGDAEVHLALDVGAELLDPLGFELFFHHQPVRSRLFQAVLARLRAHALCTPAQADALVAWPGFADVHPGQPEWPTSLADGFAGHSARIVRTLNHLKLSVAEGGPKAKAYLVFARRWVRR